MHRTEFEAGLVNLIATTIRCHENGVGSLPHQLKGAIISFMVDKEDGPVKAEIAKLRAENKRLSESLAHSRMAHNKLAERLGLKTSV